MRCAVDFIRGGRALVAAGCLTLLPAAAMAETPRANGETLSLQHYGGSTGNMHAIVAEKLGFCEKYNFHCTTKTINSGTLGLQTLVGKSLDVAVTAVEPTASANAAGADLVLVGTSLPSVVSILVVRSEIPVPHKAQGYPAVMADFKGLKIGVPARGTNYEIVMNAMLREAGLSPGDVTYVAVGGPQTAYTALVVGKQVDAVLGFEPIKVICDANKACNVVMDMSKGEGPQFLRDMQGAAVPFVMRRAFVDANPALMAAFYAAMVDAAAWFKDPANFDELVKIYTPLLGLGDFPAADALRRTWLKDAVASYSPTLKISRPAVKAAIDFAIKSKTLAAGYDGARIVWEKSP